jgi:hypothetical protein
MQAVRQLMLNPDARSAHCPYACGHTCDKVRSPRCGLKSAVGCMHFTCRGQTLELLACACLRGCLFNPNGLNPSADEHLTP